jgi:hypothetical protein
MSAPLLFKISAGIFALMPIGHTQMAMDLVYPGLKALGDTPAAYSSKTSWTQANGYFITSGSLIPLPLPFPLVPCPLSLPDPIISLTF